MTGQRRLAPRSLFRVYQYTLVVSLPTAEPPETGVVLKSGPGAPIGMISVFCILYSVTHPAYESGVKTNTRNIKTEKTSLLKHLLKLLLHLVIHPHDQLSQAQTESAAAGDIAVAGTHPVSSSTTTRTSTVTVNLVSII